MMLTQGTDIVNTVAIHILPRHTYQQQYPYTRGNTDLSTRTCTWPHGASTKSRLHELYHGYYSEAPEVRARVHDDHLLTYLLGDEILAIIYSYEMRGHGSIVRLGDLQTLAVFFRWKYHIPPSTLISALRRATYACGITLSRSDISDIYWRLRRIR